MRFLKLVYPYSFSVCCRAGNYPSEVLFSCRNHRNLDMRQEEFNQCEICERLFREDSMWSEIVCRVCYDMKKLHDKVHTVATPSQAPLAHSAAVVHKAYTCVTRDKERRVTGS